MIPELKKIGIVTSATAAVGLFFGVLVGALTGDFLLWMGVLAACGVGLGLDLSYGFLPESWPCPMGFCLNPETLGSFYFNLMYEEGRFYEETGLLV
jgi:hypothetical protein